MKIWSATIALLLLLALPVGAQDVARMDQVV